MTVLEAMRRPELFGAFFGDAGSWTAWRAFLAALFGLPMDESELAIYRQHTGREKAPDAPAREGWVVAGRRAGKSLIAALVAVFVATCRTYGKHLAPGERATVAVIAADRAQARVVLRYVFGLIDGAPLLRNLVVRRTASSVELVNRVVIEVHTCSYRTTRGYAFAAVIADECAFWRDESSAMPDVEVLNALRPGLATIPGSMLVAISSPYSRRGALWTAYKKHFGKDGPVLVWQADTAAMNPTVDPAIITAAYAADEAAAAAEYGAQFRRDLEAFVSREVVEACTVPGRVALPPRAGVQYRGFTDPSGGAADAFTLAVAHAEERNGAQVAVLDYLAERRPPFSPDAVVAEYAAVLKAYGVTAVQADKYAGAWVVEAFGKHGITCEQSAEPKSELYGNMLPLLNSGRAELLDHPRLHAQLLGLERRTARGGRDSIDHPPGGHDDLANAACGALVATAGGGNAAMIEWIKMIHERQEAGVKDPWKWWDDTSPAPSSRLTIYTVHSCPTCLSEWRELDGPDANQLRHAECPACQRARAA